MTTTSRVIDPEPPDASSISAVILTFNEEKRVMRAVRSVSWCSEVVIVDSGSTDRTLEIAEHLRREGAPLRIIKHAWEGFGPQKRFAIEQARGPWILSIDADEVVDDDLRASIHAAVTQPEPIAPAFTMFRRNRFMGVSLTTAGQGDDLPVRLFRKSEANFTPALVHEHLQWNGPLGHLNGCLEHHNDGSIEGRLDRLNRYSSLAARQGQQRGQSVRARDLSIEPIKYFLRLYVLRHGYRQGVRGLVWCVSMSLESFYAQAKLWELGQTETDSRHDVGRVRQRIAGKLRRRQLPVQQRAPRL